MIPITKIYGWYIFLYITQLLEKNNVALYELDFNSNGVTADETGMSTCINGMWATLTQRV